MNTSNPPAAHSVQDSLSPPDPNASSSFAPPAPERVPLPPRTSASPPPDLSRADRLLASFVVLLAFLAASTPARNSDLWLHLATGRALADGSYRFQGDPFAVDPTSTWIAHSWLTDLAAYGLFASLGGSILVILKAALVALLAALLIRLGTREGGLVWAAVAATLAVVAFSGRLLLQPALLSAVLLAVTLGLLQRGRRLRVNGANWLSAYAPICLLFALWANLDDWFLLGPLTVTLYLLGELIATVAATGDSKHADLPGLALTLGAGLLACLLTPFHIRGLTLPAELGLSATAKVLQQDPVLHNLFRSPFDGRFLSAGEDWNIPGLAYLVLVVLSGVSFFGSRDAWRSWRLPLWLGLFALSAWSVRAIPFFAVAAAPILALNLQDVARSYRPGWLRRDAELYARVGRAAAMLLLLGLLVAAWPGWLQGAPYEMRRWTVLADPSLQQAAEQIARWRHEDKLSSAEHGFNFSPEAANYLAYFCPTDKGVVDARLQVSAEKAAEYVAVRQALLGQGSAKVDWRAIFRSRRINHLVLHDPSSERVTTVYRRLVEQPKEWFLLRLTGRTVLFGWKDPQQPTAAPEKLRMSLRTEAYHPAENQKAPAEWPGRNAQTPAWWEAFATAPPAGFPDRDKAALLLMHFETLRPSILRERSVAWESSCIAAAIGSSGGMGPFLLPQALNLYSVELLHSGLPAVQGPLRGLPAFALGLRDQYFQDRDDAPPELLWLAVRAARRAVHQHPDDVQAYAVLGQAYLDLARNTRERASVQRFPFLARVRTVQAAAAFHQALIVNPDYLPAHVGLATLYEGMGQIDLRTQHLRETLRLTQSRERSPSETAEEWVKRVNRLQEEVKQLERTLHATENRFELSSANLKATERATAAYRCGLGGKALEILLSLDVPSYGASAVQMELELLFSTGRVQEVREWMLPEYKQMLGEVVYTQDRLLLAAGCGDYETIQQELDHLSAHISLGVTESDTSLRTGIALSVSHLILEGRLQKESLPQYWVTQYFHRRLLHHMATVADILQKEADINVLRGVVALERGDTTTACDFLRRALHVYQSETAVREGRGMDFGGRPLALSLVEALAEPPG